MDKKFKNIYIIATGGTIAGLGTSGRTSEYTAGVITLKDLLKSIPKLAKKVSITGEQMLNIDSNEMTISYWLQIAQKINELAEGNTDGFVITHGTDTLDETAYFLNLVVKTDKPVVLTGAMRPATAASPDGPLNLYQAISLASTDAARDQGVLVVFSDGIYSGRNVQKANTFRVDAYHEADFACLGYMRDDESCFYSKAIKRHTLHTQFDVSQIKKLPVVQVAYYTVDSDPGVLDFLAEVSEGIVIAGAGNGNYSQKWIEKIESLSQKGIPVVRSSRIGSGLVSQNSRMDQSDNCIPGNTLSPHKARILLTLALTVTHDFNEIRNMFQIY